MTTYTITSTNGAHIRDQHRTADKASVYETLQAAGKYLLGERANYEVEDQEGGTIYLIDSDAESSSLYPHDNGCVVLVAAPVVDS